jgi:hypothetical protein
LLRAAIEAEIPMTDIVDSNPLRGGNYGKRYNMSFSRAKDTIRDKLLSYAAEYGPITVRGLFYAVLAAGLIDKADDEKIGRLVAQLRREGALDWDLVVDGSRQCHEAWTHRSVRAGVESMLDIMRIDPWAKKRKTVIVLIEKDALTGVIEPVTNRYAVPLYPVRGYNSLTKLREIALRIRNDGRPCAVYQLGDLDPSGDHATEEAKFWFPTVLVAITALGGVFARIDAHHRLGVSSRQITITRSCEICR